jgi:hypothetical protein
MSKRILVVEDQPFNATDQPQYWSDRLNPQRIGDIIQ